MFEEHTTTTLHAETDIFTHISNYLQIESTFIFEGFEEYLKSHPSINENWILLRPEDDTESVLF